MNDNFSSLAARNRELGKAYYYNEDSTCDERKLGLNLLVKAQIANDPEACFIVACLLIRGILTAMPGVDAIDGAFELIVKSARLGYTKAREFLDAYCEENYCEEFGYAESENFDFPGLVDFDGKPIEINRSGKFTPVKAVLSYEDGKNILTLSANVHFVYTEEMSNEPLFEEAVYRGLLEWEGDYVVFGGQKVTLKVNITNEERLLGNVWIIPMSRDLRSEVKEITDKLATKKIKKKISNVFDFRRSFASAGIRWRVNSLRLIYVQSDNDRFDDYEEIRHVAKHEFGHAIGLGDLYESAVDSLAGVKKGTYPELDCYAVGDKYYNQVMCDHRGPITNNDIEMVILAFRENRMQLFQPQKPKLLFGKISSALGKGN